MRPLQKRLPVNAKSKSKVSTGKDLLRSLAIAVIRFP